MLDDAWSLCAYKLHPAMMSFAGMPIAMVGAEQQCWLSRC